MNDAAQFIATTAEVKRLRAKLVGNKFTHESEDSMYDKTFSFELFTRTAKTKNFWLRDHVRVTITTGNFGKDTIRHHVSAVHVKHGQATRDAQSISEIITSIEQLNRAERH